MSVISGIEFALTDNYLKILNCKKNIAVWGTGRAGKITAIILEEMGISISLFIDNSLSKAGTKILGIDVVTSENLEEIKGRYFVVIASMYFKSIELQLLSHGFIHSDFCRSVIIHSNLSHRMILATIFKNLDGIEIGAFFNPAYIPNSTVRHLDVVNNEMAARAYPDRKDDIVDIDYVCNLNNSTATLLETIGRSVDFVIMHHVLEHVTNPIRFIKNVLDGVTDNGYLALSIPDKNYTLDKIRPLTEFSHILSDYELNIDEISSEHITENYRINSSISKEDFLSKYNCTNGNTFMMHCHVWDSDTFKEQLSLIFEKLHINVTIIFESTGFQNKFEYFCIIKKGDCSQEFLKSFSVKVLKHFYYHDISMINRFGLEINEQQAFISLLDWINQAEEENYRSSIDGFIMQYKNIFKNISIGDFVYLWEYA